MNTIMNRYGLTDLFYALSTMYEGLSVGRVVSQEKGLYRIVTDAGHKHAEVSGKFRYNAKTVSDFPAVGDFIMADTNENGGNAVIHHVLDRTFSDIEELALQCRFSSCTHSGEKGCAVCAAIESGELSEDRLVSYNKLKSELAYAEDSESYLAAKRSKFKEIAKYNKTNRKR